MPYDEISAMVAARTGREVKIAHAGGRAVKLMTSVSTRLPFINREVSKSVSVVLSDITLSGIALCFRYDAGVAINWLMPLVTKHLPAAILDRGIVELRDDCTVVVNLDKIDKANEALRHISPRSLNFGEQGADLAFDLLM